MSLKVHCNFLFFFVIQVRHTQTIRNELNNVHNQYWWALFLRRFLLFYYFFQSFLLKHYRLVRSVLTARFFVCLFRLTRSITSAISNVHTHPNSYDSLQIHYRVLGEKRKRNVWRAIKDSESHTHTHTHKSTIRVRKSGRKIKSI